MNPSRSELVSYTRQALQIADGALDALDLMLQAQEAGERIAGDDLETITKALPAARANLATIRQSLPEAP